MDSTSIVVVVIVAFGVIMFLWAAFSIYKKKDKSSGKKKKSKNKNPDEDAIVETIEFEKKERKPKINTKKLKEAAASETKIEPAFDKAEVEAERMQKIQEEIKKNKEREQQTPGRFPFPGMAFPGSRPNMTQTSSTTTRTIVPNATRPTPISTNTTQARMVVPNASAFAKTQSVQPIQTQIAQKEDEAFVEVLKQRGAISKEQSFGESLMVKEAVDTPASKLDMKKKRNKWL